MAAKKEGRKGRRGWKGRMEERDGENCISETLKLLFEGKLKSSEFPSSLDLSAIAVDMNNLWKQSIRDIKQGIVYECAGTIVLDANGHLILVNQIEGTSDLVSPDVKINMCQRFVGTFHTHPYEDGTTGIAFSGGDIASAILGKEQLSIVQSGEEVFALVRTEKTPTSVNYTDIKQELEDIFKVYLRRGMSVQHAAITANLDICKHCGLAFYYGRIHQKLEGEYFP